MISDEKNFNSGLEFGSGKLLTDLFTHIEDRKIIFIGDNAQLTPINMNFSPALNTNYIRKNFTHCWKLFYEMQIPLVLSWKKAFGDFETWHIWGIIVTQNSFKKSSR